MDLSSFSVFSNDIALDTEKGIITKTYSLNVDVDISHHELKKLMDDYILSMRKANINIPKVIDSSSDEHSITYVCEFCGRNIVEIGLTMDTFLNFKIHIKRMLEMVSLAMKNRLYFDPHPKNFVFDKNDNIYYVDFFPPYTKELKEKRLAIAKESEKKIISDNYDYFHDNFLPPHFCGDFLNINPKFEIFFSEIYNEASNLEIVSDSLEEFIAVAKSIRRTEDLRIERKIDLL